MSTRSLTFIYEKDGSKPFTCIYKQFDGYIEGYGLELAKFLNSKRMVNGITSPERHSVFNGMNCLAAQLVEQFKEEAGDIYIYSAEVKKFTGKGQDEGFLQEYEYRIYPDKVIVFSYDEKEFEGAWIDFYKYAKEKDVDS